MLTLTLIALSLSSVSLAVSIGALIATRRTSDRSLRRRLDELSERLEGTDRFTEQIMVRLRSETAKNNMRWLRSSQKATADAETSLDGLPAADGTEAAKDEWTRRTNLAILRGEIKMPGRR